MTECVLLAPGPSMSQKLANFLRFGYVGVVGTCYQLAPWAHFLVANDPQWWKAYDAIEKFEGRKFSTNQISGVERIKNGPVCSASNSGVLGLEVAKQLGFKTIYLYGFDMHGSHYFGNYENGLKNTKPNRREVHKLQYEKWFRANNGKIEVYNCTPGSMLNTFPKIDLDLEELLS